MRKGSVPIIILLSVVALFIAALFGLVAMGLFKNSNLVKNSVKEFTSSKEEKPKEAKWQEFNSVDGHFKILLPAYPEREEKNETIPNSKLTVKQITYSVSQGESMYYSVSVAFYPETLDFSDPKKVLEAVVNGAVSAEGNNSSLISSEFGNYKNNPMVNAHFKGTRDSHVYEAKTRAILVGKTLYMVLGVFASGNVPQDYERFVNSFELLP